MTAPEPRRPSDELTAELTAEGTAGPDPGAGHRGGRPGRHRRDEVAARRPDGRADRRGHGPVGGRPLPGARVVPDAGPGGRRAGLHRRAARPVPGPGRARGAADRGRGAAAARRRRASRFAAHGIDLLLAPAAALDVILDKLALARHCADVGPRAADRAAGRRRRPGGLGATRSSSSRARGSGSRGIAVLSSPGELAALGRAPAGPAGPGVPARRGVLHRRAGRRRRPRDRVGAAAARPGRLRCLRRRPDGARPRAGGVRPGRRGGDRPHVRGQRPVPSGTPTAARPCSRSTRGSPARWR